jgi:hypothetical protein
MGSRNVDPSGSVVAYAKRHVGSDGDVRMVVDVEDGMIACQ